MIAYNTHLFRLLVDLINKSTTNNKGLELLWPTEDSMYFLALHAS